MLTRVITLVGEVTGPVLFGRHIGVPGRITIAAVIQGATGHGACRAVERFNKIGAAHRAVQLHWRQTSDPAVQGVKLNLPFIVGAFDHAHHGHPVAVQFLEHLISRALAVIQRWQRTTAQR